VNDYISRQTISSIKQRLTIKQLSVEYFLKNRRVCHVHSNVSSSGEVLCLNTTVDESMNIKSTKITGPLIMYPPADDNYSEDACSILVLDTVPPSVIIASNFGELYNCLLLPEIKNKVGITQRPTYILQFVLPYLYMCCLLYIIKRNDVFTHSECLSSLATVD